jgi:hypothetical protein
MKRFSGPCYLLKWNGTLVCVLVLGVWALSIPSSCSVERGRGRSGLYLRKGTAFVTLCRYRGDPEVLARVDLLERTEKLSGSWIWLPQRSEWTTLRSYGLVLPRVSREQGAYSASTEEVAAEPVGDERAVNPLELIRPMIDGDGASKRNSTWDSWTIKGPSSGAPRTVRTALTYITIPCWLIFLPVALPTAFLWYRDRRRYRAGQCTMCGYDLTGNVSGRCPECGKAT